MGGIEEEAKGLTLKVLVLAVILGAVIAGFTVIVGPLVWPSGVLSREFAGYQWGRLRARAMWATGLVVWLTIIVALLNSV